VGDAGRTRHAGHEGHPALERELVGHPARNLLPVVTPSRVRIYDPGGRLTES
jgi:hypothetical protein